MSSTRTNKNWFGIIMAGGSGERFWPVSRKKQPKQLIKLLGKESFLQQTVRRITSIIDKENVFVITNVDQAAMVKKQLPQLPPKNIIAEPLGRDTCAAVTLRLSVHVRLQELWLFYRQTTLLRKKRNSSRLSETPWNLHRAVR